MAFLSARPFNRGSEPEIFSPCSPGQLGPSPRPAAERRLLLLGRNFLQWRRPTQQGEGMACGGRLRISGGVSNLAKGRVGSRGICSQAPVVPLPHPVAAKAMQRFEPGGDGSSGRNAPRQRLLLLEVVDKKVHMGQGLGGKRGSIISLTLTPDLQLQLLTYNWAPDLGAALGRALVRLVQWQNARAHLIFCLLSQKLGLFHHYGQLDFPVRDEKVPAALALPIVLATEGSVKGKTSSEAGKMGQTEGRGSREGV